MSSTLDDELNIYVSAALVSFFTYAYSTATNTVWLLLRHGGCIMAERVGFLRPPGSLLPRPQCLQMPERIERLLAVLP